MSRESGIAGAARALKDADALLITAGAGMGVDSGLPDFRSAGGLWNAYPPMARLGKSFIELADPRWFRDDPKLAWGFYGYRLNLYRKTEPHEGFRRLLEIARLKRGGHFVFTSNVDGHFQKAGYDENLIEECHGSIHHFQCSGPCCDRIWDAGGVRVAVDEETLEAREPLPRCEACGAVARPNVLMFGDWHWIEGRTEAQAHRFAEWLDGVRERGLRLAVLEIGAGTAIATVRSTSEYVARLFDARLVRINPREYSVPDGQIAVPLGAREGIAGICGRHLAA
ncbi:MAG: Sir2 family NAD-dependent protein deacetylase [Candidatus Eisenbacteria bacterium]